MRSFTCFDHFIVYLCELCKMREWMHACEEFDHRHAKHVDVRRCIICTLKWLGCWGKQTDRSAWMIEFESSSVSAVHTLPSNRADWWWRRTILTWSSINQAINQANKQTNRDRAIRTYIQLVHSTLPLVAFCLIRLIPKSHTRTRPPWSMSRLRQDTSRCTTDSRCRWHMPDAASQSICTCKMEWFGLDRHAQ